jgi:hypothetical protein
MNIHSPLSMAMHAPVLHQFINFLAQKKLEQEANPDQHIHINLDKEQIAQVREVFRQSILEGERHLHHLSHLCASILLDGHFELHSNVIGLLPGVEERPFHIREKISTQTLLSIPDIDLGNHMLDNFRYKKESSWVSLELSANFVEYLPLTRPQTRVNRLTSRVKAEEELWNKVTDELFAIDELVERDKHLRQYSKFVKDIFGIKIVCEDESTCYKVHEHLQEITLAQAIAHNVDISKNAMLSTDNKHSAKLLDFIETKDYLGCEESSMKKTGWKALKSVTNWNDRLIEFQVQPLDNYYLEIDHMAGPSHNSFKIRRDALREALTAQLPLYGVFRDLLKNLFHGNDISFERDNASVVIT